MVGICVEFGHTHDRDASSVPRQHCSVILRLEDASEFCKFGFERFEAVTFLVMQSAYTGQAEGNTDQTCRNGKSRHCIRHVGEVGFQTAVQVRGGR